MTVTLFDDRSCALGEGPLWHPERGELLWFDILVGRLLSKTRTWDLGEMASAAGWIDRETLLVATETRLARLDLRTGDAATLVELEAGQSTTRSNDGRADPWGGFWIGTMDKTARPKAGAIYRFFRGELRQVVPDVSVPNAICFAPDRSAAYFSDSDLGQIFRLPLGATDGWPVGAPVLFRDLTDEDGLPDGAVVDAEGVLWNAQWGGARVAAYSPEGRFVRAVQVPPRHASCPAFGGPDLSTLYVTSAQQGIPEDILQAEPENGQTFSIAGLSKGLPDYRVIL